MLALTLLACTTVPAPPATLVDDASVPCTVNEGDQEATLTRGEDDRLVIDWEHDSFWAVAVTSPGAQIQRGGLLESGRVTWGVGGQDFGVQLTPPLVYGEIPERATDYTAYMGGEYEELDPVRCYEVQFSDPAHLGFGRKQFRLEELPSSPF